MKPIVTDFDPSAYLDNEEVIVEYLSQVMEDGNTDELLAALGHVAKTRGMNRLAENTGLGRESLYKVVSTKTSHAAAKLVIKTPARP
ncbi:MAG: putative addiction module antidote protein [Magnetococcales bacterium]|nr:putative addiction module antidote protein [Magnetococcales bacterium]